jgi:predicted nucleic acid-binding protein
MYLLDANAFMEANRLYYAFDIAPGFWTWLSSPSLVGQVASNSAVRDEITAGTGELVDWARSLPAGFWLADTGDVLAAMTELSGWALDPERSYKQSAVDEFLGSADLHLVAHAMARSATLVTRERPEPESRKNIKIPDVCDAFGVAWSDPFNMYRALGMRLV